MKLTYQEWKQKYFSRTADMVKEFTDDFGDLSVQDEIETLIMIEYQNYNRGAHTPFTS